MSKTGQPRELFPLPEPATARIRPRGWKTIQETTDMKALILLLFPLPAVGGYWLMGRIDRFISRIHRS